jgi:serine/threonine protein kinase
MGRHKTNSGRRLASIFNFHLFFQLIATIMKELFKAASIETKKSNFLLGPSEARVVGNKTVPSIEALQNSMSSNESFPELAFKRKQYHFFKTLGSGTYATVMEAKWLPTQQMVAVKVMKKSRMKGQEKSLKTELDILASVEHPNLLKLLDWGFDKDTICIVTELARGGELFDRIIATGFLFERDVADVIRSVLKAVSYLHAKNIVHRDLKVYIIQIYFIKSG